MADLHDLVKTELFADFGDAELETLSKSLRPLHIGKGEALVTEGEATRGPLFIVLSGHVEVSRKDAKGTSHTLVTLEPPMVIGEMEFLADIESSATVVATDTVEGFLLPRARFEKLFGEGDATAYHIALSIGRILSHRLAESNKLMTKVLGGDSDRLVKVAKAQLSPEALVEIDKELDSLLEGI